MPPTMKFRIATFIKNRAQMEPRIATWMEAGGYDKRSDPEAYVKEFVALFPPDLVEEIVKKALAGKKEEMEAYQSIIW